MDAHNGGLNKIPQIFLSSFKLWQLDVMHWMKLSILGLKLVITKIFLLCCFGKREGNLSLSMCLTFNDNEGYQGRGIV